MDGWMDGWIDRQADRETHRLRTRLGGWLQMNMVVSLLVTIVNRPVK